MRGEGGCDRGMGWLEKGGRGGGWLMEGEMKGLFEKMKDDVLMGMVGERMNEEGLVGVIGKLVKGG